MFDWLQFYALALTLAAQRGDEAAQRSAISRAYYAAFHRALDYLVTYRSYQATNTGEDHRNVWDYFVEQPAQSNPNWQGIGTRGKQLREYRRLADYHSSIVNLDAYTTDAMNLAEAILSLVAGLRR